MTGAIVKVEPFTEGEDLAHAKSQKAAMDRGKVKPADAATKAKGTGEGRSNGGACCECGARAEGQQSRGDDCSAAKKEVLSCFGTARLGV
jgi:hypothetical protein